ncbi:MAG: GEVED domain-containing protein [Chitinophagales bacterium]
MKKQIVHLTFLFLVSILLTNPLIAQSKKMVAKQVASFKTSYGNFKQATPFTVLENDIALKATSADFVSKATFAKLDKTIVQQLYNERSAAISLSVPYHNGSTLLLELIQVDIFAEGFKVTNSANETENYNTGVYYRGIIQGDENSLVAVSIFEDNIMGIISNEENGNINLGKYEGTGAKSDDYILFSEKDVLVPHEAGCATPDVAEPKTQDAGDETGDSRTTNIVKVYLEADFQLYQNKGSSVTATSDYLTGIFNTSATIFANDGITTEISEIFVWTSSDGYASSSSFAALSDFTDFRTTFNGDVAHLVALDANNGGVAATIDGFCSSTGKYCYSDIDASYSEFPTYSWTVMVFTHELGHIYGSFHTHWCGWSGGAIDDCGPSAGYGTEGGCAAGPTPTTGGTIMSYCHLTVGINFSNGFGTQPANAIIDAIEAAPCLTGGGGGPTDYCASAGASSTSQWIDRVRLGAINRVSGSDGGYWDGTEVTNTNLKIGITKSLKVSAGMSGGAVTVNWKGWIDWNQDFDFDDAGEEILSLASSITTNLTATLVAPITATLGSTRMRISMKNGGVPGSCESFSLGEVEDFNVTILAALPSGELVVDENDEMLIYPNPAQNNFFINCSSMESEEVLIEIVDLTGRVVAEKIFSSTEGEISFNLENISTGMYIVKTTGDDGKSRLQNLIIE